jgi:cysteine-rich repeat protein
MRASPAAVAVGGLMAFGCVLEPYASSDAATTGAGGHQGGKGGDAGSSGAASGGEAGAGGKSTCGNSALEQGETCDDGNVVTGDGCSAECDSEESCPGARIALSPGVDVLIIGNTVGKSNDHATTKCDAGVESNDLVYRVEPTAAGTVYASYNAEYNGSLYLRAPSCVDTRAEQCATLDSASLMIEVAASQPAYVFVDGGSGENGPFSLTLSLVP